MHIIVTVQASYTLDNYSLLPFTHKINKFVAVYFTLPGGSRDGMIYVCNIQVYRWGEGVT